jgi:hypothetical protein
MNSKIKYFSSGRSRFISLLSSYNARKFLIKIHRYLQGSLIPRGNQHSLTSKILSSKSLQFPFVASSKAYITLYNPHYYCIITVIFRGVAAPRIWKKSR